METVNVGTDATLSYGSSGDWGASLLPTQWGNVSGDINPGDKEATVGISAQGIGIGHHAWAEEWTDFSVSGDTSRSAVISFNGEYAAALSAMATSSSRAKGSVFIRDITSGSNEIDDDVVFDEKAQFYNIIPITPSGPIDDDDRMVVTLEPGHDYRVGVRAWVWALADGPVNASADMTSAGAPGYIRYSDVTISWQ